ncbi:MAG: hypothetical protein Q4G30_02645 [Actinomycetaceae bacterium]|nr:hypothetical protein [Actinomycetaceae bacterium]
MSPNWGTDSTQYRDRHEEIVNKSSQDFLLNGLLSQTVPRAPLLKARSIEEARARYQHALVDSVFSMSMIEGISVTLPQVHALIDGVSVGGLEIEDVQAVTDMISAHRLLAHMVQKGTFELNKTVRGRINAAITAHEIIEPGIIRGQGKVGGTVTVTLGDLPAYEPPPTTQGGLELEAMMVKADALIGQIENPVEGAATLFCHDALAQYYSNGNKRTATLMATGWLLTHGYDPLVFPARLRLDYNEALRALFGFQDNVPISNFIYHSIQSLS